MNSMHGIEGPWTAAGAAQDAAVAASSAWNASYFFRRTFALVEAPTSPAIRARRLAAALLTLLFAGIAIEAIAAVPVADTAAEVTRRVPLLLATLGVAFVVSYGGAGGER